MPERALQRRLGVQARHEHRVVEHQELGVEEIGVLGAGGRMILA
jgi:hypothetical protein